MSSPRTRRRAAAHGARTARRARHGAHAGGAARCGARRPGACGGGTAARRGDARGTCTAHGHGARPAVRAARTACSGAGGRCGALAQRAYARRAQRCGAAHGGGARRPSLRRRCVGAARLHHPGASFLSHQGNLSHREFFTPRGRLGVDFQVPLPALASIKFQVRAARHIGACKFEPKCLL